MSVLNKVECGIFRCLHVVDNNGIHIIVDRADCTVDQYNRKVLIKCGLEMASVPADRHIDNAVDCLINEKRNSFALKILIGIAVTHNDPVTVFAEYVFHYCDN